MADLLLPLLQAREMLYQMIDGEENPGRDRKNADRAKWRRYRIAAAISVNKRVFGPYDMAKLAYVVARVKAGETLAQAHDALWRIIDPIEDGPDYEQRAIAAIETELNRLTEI